MAQGIDNLQPSIEACMESCANNSGCTHWTWLPPGEGTNTGNFTNRCYLKDKRENFTPSDDRFTYVSGAKYCPDYLNFLDGGGSSGRSNYNNGYRMDVIKINKNSNENTGATVTVNAASEEAPGDGSESEAEQEEPGNGSESEESGKSP